MAGLGFKDFQVGEVLTSSDVDGYLMQQTVMRFADSGARGSALGTATGTAVPLAEGMVTYLDDVNRIEMYTGSGWITPGGFSASTAITTTDATWSVPALADPVIRVTVIGGGGEGGIRDGGAEGTRGSTGGTTTFACSAGTATASGGVGGANGSANGGGQTGTSWGGGGEGQRLSGENVGLDGRPGQVRIAYFDMTGIGTAAVTVGAGGTGGAGGDGGPGAVIVEYRAV